MGRVRAGSQDKKSFLLGFLGGGWQLIGLVHPDGI
jgi:hypothetical protein